MLAIVWLPLYEGLRERGAVLAIVLAGPFVLVTGAVLAGARERWRAAGVLAAASFALDLGFELWVGRHWRVATTAWEAARLAAIVPAVAVAPWLAGRGRALAWCARVALGAGALLALAGVALCLRGAAPTRVRAGARADAAVVLGFALGPDGRAPPALVARVKHAASLWRRGRVRTIVLTGGRGAAGPAESRVADAVARQAGVAAEALVREERSQTTAGNLREAARIAGRMHWRSLLVVTEPYHAARAMMLARAVALPARPSLAPSPLWTAREGAYWVVREVAYLPAALLDRARGRAAPPGHREAALELFESAPVETTLDHADLRDAFVVWPERIARARRTLDVAEFYASNEPASRLEPTVRALEAAATRGVRVRFLADEGFAHVYPDTLARLRRRHGVSVRTLDFSKRAGGILHAKYFVVDGAESVLGSQNFDWRSLTHIQELGARVADGAVGRALTDVFETDWALAGGAAPGRRARTPAGGHAFPSGLTLVASPRDWLPDESLWDLPYLVAWIDGARRSVRVQLLTFGDDEGRWPVLGDALRRAAARGVRVELLVANWSLRPRTRGALARLVAAPGLNVRIVTIPPARGGFVPFARVVHAKYLVVDGVRAWVGTSNWERDYFLESRNVGLLIDRPGVARRLEAFFAGLWGSRYAEPFDPARAYPAPRVAE